MIIHSTEISIPGGSIKLSDLVTGFTLDEQTIISAYDIKKKKVVEAEVASTRKSDSKEMLYVSVSTDEHVLLTPGHRVYVVNDSGGEYIRADKLSKNMKLLHVLGEECVITDIHMIRDNEIQTTYTLTVHKFENYFCNNILVHNCKGPNP